MSTEDEPKKLSEDDPQATPTWHRARAQRLRQERLHEDGVGARADRADARAPAGTANKIPSSTADRGCPPRTPTSARIRVSGRVATAGFQWTPEWHRARARFLRCSAIPRSATWPRTTRSWRS